VTDGETKILAELETIRVQLNVFAKRFGGQAQELRRLREANAKLKAERNLARRMLSVKQASADPVDYETLKQHSHRKTPQ
jgi:regulator of replication initiation timing